MAFTQLNLNNTFYFWINNYLKYFFALVLCFISYKIFMRKRKADCPPGPWGLPLLGHLPWLGEKPHLPIEKWCREYGDVMQLYFGSRRVVIVSSLQTVKTCFLDQWNDFGERPDFIALHLITSGKAVVGRPICTGWRLQRKVMRNSIKTLMKRGPVSISAVEEHALREAHRFTEQLVTKSLHATPEQATPSNAAAIAQHRLREVPEKFFEFDPRDDLFDAIFRLLYSLCFGEAERNCEELHRFKQAQKRIVKYFNGGLLQDFFPWIKAVYPSDLQSLQNDVDFTEQIVTNERELYLKNNASLDYFNSSATELMKPLIQSVNNIERDPQMNGQITDEEIYYLTVDFINAGLFASNNWLCWLLYHIARYPEIQNRAHQEINSVIGTSTSVCAKDRDKLPYTEAVVWESFRYATNLPLLIPHMASRDTKIEGYRIPKGTIIFANVWGLSRDERLWKEPTSFTPERFLKKIINTSQNNLNSIDDCTSKPADKDPKEFEFSIDQSKVEQLVAFGIGSRRCIGEAQARLQIFIVAATIIQRCEVILTTHQNDKTETELLGGEAPSFKIIAKPRQ